MRRLCLVCILLLLFAGSAWGQTAEEADKLNARLVELYEAGEYDEAIVIGKQALSISEKVLGADHPDTATSLNNLAGLYEVTGDYQKALPLYNRALAISEKSLGADHPDTATSLNNLAVLYESMGDFQRALPLYQRSLIISEKVLGPEHPDTATSLNNLAGLYESTGDYQQALKLYKRSLAIYEDALGAENPDTAASLNNLAGLYESIGDYRQALPLYQRSLTIYENVLGADHPDTATSLNNLASLYELTGDYRQALPLYQRSLAISEKALGPEHPDTATSLNNLASLFESTGDYQQALPLYQRSLAISEKTLGPEHPETATSLNNLASLYKSMGDYRKALPLHQSSLAINEKVLGTEHPATARCLSGLASVYEAMGDFQQALPLYQRSLAINENALGIEHPATATSLNNLALLYHAMGDDQQALSLFQRALEIYERAFGPEHLSVAGPLNNLALAHEALGDHQQALPLYQRSLSITQESLGSEHPKTAANLNNLAFLYKLMGDNLKALTLNERSLAIREKVLGLEHPDTTESLNNLAYLRIDMDQPSLALDLARRDAAGTLATTTNIFTFASERQRLAYQAKLAPYDLSATLESAPDLIQASLRYKGLVLDSMVEDLRLAEASDDPAVRTLAAQVKSVKGQLNKLVFETSANLTVKARENQDKNIAKLKKDLEALQGQLARKGAESGSLRRAFSVTPAQVQAALGPESVLVEFVRYGHYLGANRWESRYGAILLPPKGEPVWAPLPAKAEDLESLIANYGKLVRGQKFTRAALEVITEPGPEVSASLLLTELYEKIWKPVEDVLPSGTQIVVLSPDGELNFLSFATLITPNNTFLAQEYILTYVSSGRDLVAEPAKGSDALRVLVGDPSYGDKVSLKQDRTGLTRAIETREWNSISFAPLPYTRAECEGLETFFESRNQKVTKWLNEEASEKAIRGLEAPATLHVATHGYFLPDSEAHRKEVRKPGARDLRRPLRDPMYRSGLALAGAQTTVLLHRDGKSPDSKNDGLLTAAEVGILNLRGTHLVTLSACDTGGGESKAGEGVLGLRRGFVQAGARNLIMSLWPVSDKETSEMMQDFYARAESQPAPLAFAEVQREWLTRLHRQMSLDEAVRLAGPFVLTFQGPME